MPVSDSQLFDAWGQVLALSELEPGQTVTVLTSTNTHPQTLATAVLAARAKGAIVNRLDLPPMNGESALSRDSLSFFGTTPLTGNRAALAMLKESDLVLDLMVLLFSKEQNELLASGTKNSSGRRAAGGAGPPGADRGGPRPRARRLGPPACGKGDARDLRGRHRRALRPWRIPEP